MILGFVESFFEKYPMSLQHLTNTALFRLFVEKGSKEAISLYFQNQTDLFYRVALKYTRNAADAEDVLQASFINIINKASQYNGVHSDEEKLLQSWCLSVVVQCALMKIRSESSRRKREIKYSASNDKSFSDEKNMESNLENKAVFQKVEKVIFELPEKYRIPIHLKYIEGLELDAIAEILKLNGNTLRSLIKRGLEKVSAQLKEENVTMSSVGLIGLLQEMPMEQAPLAAKTIANNIFNASLKSSRMLISDTKASFVTVKAISFFISICIVGAVGYFTYQWNLGTSTKTIDLPQKVMEIEEKNQTWDFAKAQDRNLDLLVGDWEWSVEKGSMIPKNYGPIVISFPIHPPIKTIMMELEIGSYFFEGTDHRKTFFLTGWAKNNMFLEDEAFVRFDPNYLFDRNKISNIKIYLYKNFICFYDNDNSYNLIKYNGEMNGSNLVFATTYFRFRKINKKVLSDPPQELLQILKRHENEVGQKSERLLIDEENFYKQKTKLKIK
jgi:RNA polymerase sigma-70 factor (ECF subfamily)